MFDAGITFSIEASIKLINYVVALKKRGNYFAVVIEVIRIRKKNTWLLT